MRRFVCWGITTCLLLAVGACHRRSNAAVTLDDAAPNAFVVVRGDVARARPLITRVAGTAIQGLAAFRTACGFDPLARIDSFTASVVRTTRHDPSVAVVLRGGVDAAAIQRCISGIATQVNHQPLVAGAAVAGHPTYSTSATPGADDVQMVVLDHALVVASPDILQAVVNGLEHPGSVPPNATLRAAAATLSGNPELAILVDGAMLRAALPNDVLDGVGSGMPGLSREQIRTLWLGMQNLAFGIGIQPAALHYALRTQFAQASEAQTAVSVGNALTTMMRMGLAMYAQGQATPSADERQLMTAAGTAMNALQFTANGTVAQLDLDIPNQVIDLARASVQRYMLRAKTSEAVEHLASIVVAEQTYAAGEHADTTGAVARPGFSPSAPRTPAVIPLGTRVVDPPGTWDTPAWQALSFAISDPHYYSYEVISNGTSFTARAYGDLDGNGITSTFERTGTIDSSGEAQVTPLRTVRELE